jgi:hypothetical protein
VEAICNVLNQSLSQRDEAEKKRSDIEANLQEEFTGGEDRQFLLSLLSLVKNLPDTLKLQMRTEMMQVVMKCTQQIPPSHFVQP